jgi:hypothetical protein
MRCEPTPLSAPHRVSRERPSVRVPVKVRRVRAQPPPPTTEGPKSMIQGDVKGSRSSPHENWLAVASLNDPNAALLASVRPPEDSLGSTFSRRFRGFIDDVLGRPPQGAVAGAEWRRSTAPRWILAGVFTVCTGMGLAAISGPDRPDPASSAAVAGSTAHAESAVRRVGTSVFDAVNGTEKTVSEPLRPAPGVTVASGTADSAAAQPLQANAADAAEAARPELSEKQASSAAKKKARASARRRVQKSWRASR